MSKYTVLVVDDDKDIVRNLHENLSEISSNYTIKTSFDGKEALNIIINERLDLVILELQIPGLNGLQLLSELRNKGIWLPIIIMTDSNVNENDNKLKDFGIVDFIKKPFLFEKVVLTIDEIMKNKEKKDLIKNLSLPSILQLIEMEKRTGVLTIRIGKENGRIFFRNGKVMDVEVKGLSAGEALEEFIQSLYEDREISIEYINHRKDKKIDMSLMQIVMEATRIKDERRNNKGKDESRKEDKKDGKTENLQIITDLLNSLREVESFIIVNEEGDVLTASPVEYNEDVLNSSIYLNIIGDKLGTDLNLGIPASLICYLKSRKRLIRKLADFIVIMELTKMTKYSVFREKFNELLDKITLKLEERRL
jgi:DNA-binding response OmpR family regulator